MSIEKNLTEIINSIPENVTLVAVTKKRTVEEVQHVVDFGITDLGENRVQELLDKYYKIEGKVRWHLIGHLQRNKVKYIIDKVHLIHSVDSLRLVEEIEAQSKKINKTTDILIQVNISKEDSKFGIDEEEIFRFIDTASACKNVSIKGLMTMAPYTENVEETREIFKKLYVLYDKIKENTHLYNNVSMEYLSMGMTNDYSIAVQEGSNMVRIGTGIFK